MNDHWTEVTLGDLATQTRNAIVGGPFGSNLVSNDYTQSGVPVIRGQNLQGRWIGGDFVFVSEEKAGSLSANLARPGDLVFTQRGTLGQVSMVPTSAAATYLVSQSQMKATIDPSKADVRFLYYFFVSPEQQDWIRSNSIQTGVPHTNLGILKKHSILLPSLREQTAIADVLGSLDDKIEQNRRTGAKLEGLARAVFKAWFVDFEPVKAKAAGATAFPGMPPETFAALPTRFVESELGPVPEGWEVGTIKERASVVQYGLTTSATAEPVGPRFLRITDIRGGAVDWSTVPYCAATAADSQKYRLLDGDIVGKRPADHIGPMRHSGRQRLGSRLVRLAGSVVGRRRSTSRR